MRAVYADVLEVPDVADDDTFVGLGGDSLSYVEVSMLLERAMGELPPSWHTMPVVELERCARPGRRLRAVEGNVAIRAVAIVLVVGTHASLFDVQGGAHLLLAVAGYNYARFRLTVHEVAGRLRRDLVSIARIVVPTLLWIAFMFTWREPFTTQKALLVDNVAGDGIWRYWFIEVLWQILAVLALVGCLRGFRDRERRQPFGTAMVVLAGALVLRYGLSPLGAAHEPMYRTDTVAWLFALGWASQRAERLWQRLLVTAVALLAVPGFFDSPERGRLVALGLLALVWVPRLRVPHPVNRVLAALAGASLYIFLTHYAVLPWLWGHLAPEVVVAVALVVGVGASALADRVHPVEWARRVAARRGVEAAYRRSDAGSATTPSPSATDSPSAERRAEAGSASSGVTPTGVHPASSVSPTGSAVGRGG